MNDLVYLSLGSNIGDREANLAGAITIIEEYDFLWLSRCK